MSAFDPLNDMWPRLRDTTTLIQQARRKYHPPPAFGPLLGEFGVDIEVFGPFLYIITNYDIQDLSPANYLARNCYDQPASVEQLFDAYAAAGLTEPNQHGSAQISARGRELFERTYQLVAPLWLLPVAYDDINQLLSLLGRLAQATLHAPEPPPHPAITTRMTRALHFPDSSPPLEQLNRRVYDLWAYRDDVHLAAWSQHREQVSPRDWEALTYLWRGEADSAESLANLLSDEHGWSVEDYRAGLFHLQQLSWIEPVVDRHWRLSPAGHALREEAERRTDQAFYAPWNVLNSAEIEQLRQLLQRLGDRLLELSSEG